MSQAKSRLRAAGPNLRIPAPRQVNAAQFIECRALRIAPQRAAPSTNGVLVHILLCTIRVNRFYSHSIVPQGLGVRSYSTLFTPSTSAVMRSVMCCRRANGISSTVAVIASLVLTARRITGHANVRLPSFTPTDLKSGTTVKYCHTLPSSPFLANSSRRMASERRTHSSLSRAHFVLIQEL